MKEIKTFWLKVSAYYGRNLRDDVLHMYSEDCKDMTADQLNRAFNLHRKSRDGGRFPLPGTLINLIHPQPSIDDTSREAATLIVGAIRRWGYVNPREARKMMGELAWRIVEMSGGWQAICESVTNDQIPQLTAQWRDLASSIMHGGSFDMYLPERTPRHEAENDRRNYLLDQLKDMEENDGKTH